MKSFLLLLSLATTLQGALAQTTVSLHNGEFKGTGFFVRDNPGRNSSSLIVSNFHVCSGDYEKAIKSKKSSVGSVLAVQPFGVTATVVAEDMSHDLCLLSTQISKPAFKLGSFLGRDSLNSSFILIDSTNTIMGFYVYAPDTTKDSYTSWHKDSYVGITKAVEGMSGSPVVNVNGEVVLVYWGVNHQASEGYAISVEALKELMKNYAN